MKHSNLQKLIVDLKTLQTPVWKRVANDLEAPSSNQRTVNVGKIEKVAKDGLTVVVPGKVLSLGSISKKVDVVAYQFSDAAKQKITKAGGKVFDIAAFAKKNPDGKQVQIVG